MAVEQCHAILLTGGSAFGLAAADGVMRELEADGRGHRTPAGPVPIVPAAVIFDLLQGEASVRPTAESGAAAYRSRSVDPVELGQVGAGTGATVGKWRGLSLPSGVGSATATRAGATAGALVVLNAMGDVFTLEGQPLTGGPHVAAAPAFEPEWDGWPCVPRTHWLLVCGRLTPASTVTPVSWSVVETLSFRGTSWPRRCSRRWAGRSSRL
jgi:L-aminopeptidase/D-esterase-like protein